MRRDSALSIAMGLFAAAIGLGLWGLLAPLLGGAAVVGPLAIAAAGAGGILVVQALRQAP
ncbi:MAG TPA: hypothetical protein VFH78_03055 [Candidatus Thermoplasmatota archaeon]|nr:hypothetical protein [Candidatus Thermoplasmatota archaeon]